MKIKLSMLSLSIVGVLAIGAPAASAAAECNTGTSQERVTNEDGSTTVTNNDKLADTVDGGVVYGDADQGAMSGYVGTVGPRGFIEASGDDDSGVTVQGESANAPVEGKATVGTSPSACLVGTHIVG